MPRPASMFRFSDAPSTSVFGLFAVLAFFLLVPGLGAILLAQEPAPDDLIYRQYVLTPRESLHIWELRFDLTDQEVAAGKFLIGREVSTSDALDIVTESLTRTRYSIKLRLRRGFMAYGTGSLDLRLVKGTPVAVDRLPPPTGLRLATAAYSFPFACEREGTHVAVTVFKRSQGAPVWEGVFHEHCLWEIPTDPLAIGGHYLLQASQCDRATRYSAPALLGFRVEGTGTTCGTCRGVGWLGPLPPGTSDDDERCPPPPEETDFPSTPADHPNESSTEAPSVPDPDAGNEPALTVATGSMPILTAARTFTGSVSVWPLPGTAAWLPVRPRPAGRYVGEVCPYCRGSGVRLRPYAVPEAALPNAPE